MKIIVKEFAVEMEVKNKGIEFGTGCLRRSSMTDNTKLLSELLRPQQLGDLTLPQRDIERLEHMVHSGTIMNMIFYGRPGLGKTSAARAIIAELVNNADADCYELNGSSGNGAAEVRKVQDYARSGSLNSGIKLCFIDEADFLSLQAQASLRYIVEKSSKRCRFIFTANDASRFSEAIRSRMRKSALTLLRRSEPR